MRYNRKNQKPAYYKYINSIKRINTVALCFQIVCIAFIAASLFLPIFKGEVVVNTDALGGIDSTENKTVFFSLHDYIVPLSKAFTTITGDTSPAPMIFLLLLSWLICLGFCFLAIYVVAIETSRSISHFCDLKGEALLRYHRINSLGYFKSADEKGPELLTSALSYTFAVGAAGIVGSINECMKDQMFSKIPLLNSLPSITGLTSLAWIILALVVVLIIIRAVQHRFEKSMTLSVRDEKISKTFTHDQHSADK